MSRIVRASKVRHVYPEPEKPDNCYTGLSLSPATGDHNYVKGNSKFFAVAVRGGGGPVLVLPYSATGKLPNNTPVVNGHAAPVYDMAWNPFDDNILATASEDCTVKLFHIPDGGLTENIKEAVQTLSGHGKPVSLLNWHPTANNVIASVAKEPSLKIWDVETGVANITINDFGGLVQDFAWNYNGSLIATSDKSKTNRVFDPRTNSAVASWSPHAGSKPSRLVWLGKSDQMVTVGFTAQSRREFRLWDIRNTASPLAVQELDQSAGVIMPFYDEDTKMLYLTGKGDGNIRFYEMVDSEPWFYPISEHRTNVSTKGGDFLPKRALNAMNCEVARFLKLTTDSVEPISFIVPRKEQSFAADIFPDTYAGIPSLSATEYFAGKNVENPKTISMDPSKRPGYVAPPPVNYQTAPTPSPVATPTATPKAETPNTSNTDAALKEALARAAKAEAQVALLNNEVSSLKKNLAAAAAAPAAVNDNEEIEALRARIAELEASELKLKKAVAALTN